MNQNQRDTIPAPASVEEKALIEVILGLATISEARRMVEEAKMGTRKADAESIPRWEAGVL